MVTLNHRLRLPLVLLLGACGGAQDAVSQDATVTPDAGIVDPTTRRDGAAPDSGSAADLAAADAALPPLSWGPCVDPEWNNAYGPPPANMQCAAIEVPVDHDDPGAGTLALRVGRQPARQGSTGRALFFLAGGPGGSSVEASGSLSVVFEALRETFDFIYFDQRGAGGSDYLGCPRAPGGFPNSKAEWGACADDMGARPLDHYLTLDAARDLERVRKRLGYGPVYLRGGSYGTRLALEWMRQYPTSLAAVVLDGVAPPDVDLIGAQVKNFDRAVQRLIDDCAASPGCRNVSPDLERDLKARREALRAAPAPITLDGQSYFESEGLFLRVLFGLIYSDQVRFYVPRAIHQAVEGNTDLWYQLFSAYTGMTVAPATIDPTSAARSRVAPLPAALAKLRRPLPWGRANISPGLYQTIVCAEYLPLSVGPEGLRELEQAQTWGNYPDPELGVVSGAEACAVWPVDAVDPAQQQPVNSSVKALLLSGELDMQTIPEWGDRALQHLPNGTHVVVPHTTHAAIRNPCGAQIAADFLAADGEMAQVDTSCLARVEHPGW